jgi:hypothetical protein
MARWSGRRWRGSVVAVAAGAVALGVVSAVSGPAAAEPDPGMTASGSQDVPVPLERAGSFVGWGRDLEGQLDPPASLDGVALREVVMSSNVSLALTADGRVVSWGFNSSRLQVVPDRVAAMDVVDLDAGPAYAGVVSRSGEVVVWGQATPFADPIDVPAGLSGVEQLAIGQTNGFALRSDGTVVAWGKDQFGLLTPPEGLRAVAISASSANVFALTEDGTVVGWGRTELSSLELPDAVKQPGNVVAVTALGLGGMALLADGSVVGWGSYGAQVPDLGGKRAIAIDSGSQYGVVLDEDGVFHEAGFSSGAPIVPPVAVQGRAVAQVSVGSSHVGMIVTRMLRAEAPRVSGTARVGSTLTGRPGTFSGAPDGVTGQWRADGVPISGATGASLKVTTALVGKRISYSSTAVKAGEASVTSTSAPTSAVPSPLVASRTRVTTVAVARRAAKVTVLGEVSASQPADGKARMVVKKGRTTIVARAVRVSSTGQIKSVIKGFGRLAQRKTGSWRGLYRVTLAYYGNSLVKPSTGARSFRVRR